MTSETSEKFKRMSINWAQTLEQKTMQTTGAIV